MKRLAKPLVTVVCLLIFAGSLFAAAPPNDNFANRTLLTGTNVSFSGDNTEATGEPNEPTAHPVVIPLRTLWWTWTAPASGRVRFRFTSHSFTQPFLTIYTGSSLTNLAFEADNVPRVTTGFPGYVDVSVRGGVALQIATEGVQGEQIGPQALTLEWVPAPVNDDFAGRIGLSGLPATGFGEFDGATRDPAEPRPFLNDGLPYSQFGGHSLWWSWTSPINGTVEVTNAGTFTETTLAVFTGTDLSSLQNVIRNSLVLGLRTALFPVQAGQTYQLMFDTQQRIALPGTIDFQIKSATPPANDAFAARSEVMGANFNLTALNTAATSEPGEPQHATNAAGRTLWWTWTAPSPGRVEFTGYYLRTVIALYTGETVNNLTRIGAGIRTNSPVSVGVPTAGTYHFAVDSLDDEFGEFHIQAHFIPRPANDDFANRIVVTNTAHFATAPGLVEATREPGEPWPKKRKRSPHFAPPVGSTSDRSVWWTFIAPQAGSLNIYGNMNVAVFEGDSLTNLRTLADEQFTVSIVLRSNQTIQVAARNVGESPPLSPGQSGYMSFAFAPFPENDSFTNRTPISGTYFNTTNVNFGASAEKGEPRIANNAAGSTVWYSWTAPAMGTVVFAAVSANFFPIVSAYTGDKLSALHSIASAGSKFASVAVVRFEAVEGTTYTFAVDGESSSGEPRGRVEIGLLFSTIRLANPEPDAIFHSRDPVTFAITTPDPNVEGNITNVQYLAYLPDAEQHLIGSVDTSPYSLTVSNLPQGTFAVVAFAKNDAGEERFTPEILLHVRPYNDDWAQRRAYRDYEWRDNANMIASTRERGERGGRPVGGTVWYSWIAPANGTATITHYDLSERTPIAIFTGDSLRKLRRVAGRLGYGDVSFAAVAGQEYFINITEPPRIPDQYTPFSSLIFSFDAPLINSVTNGQIFTGGAVVPLTVLPPGIVGVQRIDYLDGTNVIAVGLPPTFNAVWSNAVPGHRILNGRVVLPDGQSFHGHPIPITIRPANDHFAERAALVGTDFSFPIFTATATSEPNEPMHGLVENGGTAWWTWTAPSDGTLVLEVVGAPVPALAFYTGATFPTLTQVAQNIRYNPAALRFEQSRELTIHVSAGVTLQMAAAGGNDTAALLFRFESDPPE